MSKPSVFVGSSSQGLGMAREIQAHLEGDAEVIVWDQDVFRPSKTTVESLEEATERFDFAILLFTPDDRILRKQQQAVFSARDNVLFELGLFMGKLGRDRTFIVSGNDSKLQIPTDLAGVTHARYPARQARTDPSAALLKACAEIKRQIKALGRSEPRRLQQINKALSQIDQLSDKTAQLLKSVEIEHKKPAVWFETVAKAEDEIVRCLKACVAQGEEVVLQWLGMTMFNVWNTLPRVLDELAKEHPRSVRLEVAMLSKKWLASNRINDAWTYTSAEEVKDRIVRYFKKKSQEGLRNWTVDVRRYSHMPSVHGCLINSRILFYGICRWDQGDLRAGDRPYELYLQGDVNQGSDKIQVFKSWFDVCFHSRKMQELFAWPSRRAREASPRSEHPKRQK